MFSNVTPEARALAQALLDHHKHVCGLATDPNLPIDLCVIPYGDLCELAGMPQLKNVAGKFLREIAEWCHKNGWPPLNALAVNHATRMPGRGYDHAPGCSLANWRNEASACISFSGYPDTVA
jgi:hypothetical protein